MEAIFNTLDGVERTALVPVGDPGRQEPVLCVELSKADSADNVKLEQAVKQAVEALAAEHASLQELKRVLFHPGFPVDIRHNSKIGREALAAWAAEQA